VKFDRQELRDYIPLWPCFAAFAGLPRICSYATGFGPPVAAFQYVIHFQFCWLGHVFLHQALWQRVLLKQPRGNFVHVLTLLLRGNNNYVLFLMTANTETRQCNMKGVSGAKYANAQFPCYNLSTLQISKTHFQPKK